jgi:hypothetical protein
VAFNYYLRHRFIYGIQWIEKSRIVCPSASMAKPLVMQLFLLSTDESPTCYCFSKHDRLQKHLHEYQFAIPTWNRIIGPQICHHFTKNLGIVEDLLCRLCRTRRLLVTFLCCLLSPSACNNYDNAQS